MIRINLLQQPKATKGKGAKVAVATTPGGPPPWLVPVGIAVLVLTLVVLGGWYFKVSSDADKLTAENARIQKDVDSKQQFLEKAKRLEAQKAELESRINQIKALKAQQQGPVYLMKRLYETKPDEGLWFTEVTVTDPVVTVTVAGAPSAAGKGAAPANTPVTPVAPPPSTIHIRGVGVNQTIVSEFVTRLENKKEWFPSVTLKSIHAVASPESGLEGREFELDVSFASVSGAGVTP